MNIRYARGGSSIIAPLGIPLAGPAEGPQILFGELQAWMIKAWKAIIDTAGHYSRPDLVRLMVSNHAPSRDGVLAFHSSLESLSPRSLADAADRHGVEPARAEALLESTLAERRLA